MTLPTNCIILAWICCSSASAASLPPASLTLWADTFETSRRLKEDGQLDQAEQALRRLLPQAGETGLPAAALAHLYHDLGSLCQDRNRQQDALGFYDRAAEAWQQAGPRYRLHLASTLNNKASLLWEDGRLSEAARVLERSVAMHSATAGETNEELPRILYNLGSVYLALERNRQAGETFAKLLAITEPPRRQGYGLIAAASAAINLGHLTGDEGAEYRALGLALWAKWKAEAPPQADVELLPLTDLAMGLWKTNARAEATEVARRMASELARRHGSTDSRLLPPLKVAALILRKQHHKKEAETLEHQAQRIAAANQETLLFAAQRVDIATLSARR